MHQLFTWPIAGYCLTLLLWRHFCPTIVFYELVFDFLLLSTNQDCIFTEVACFTSYIDNEKLFAADKAFSGSNKKDYECPHYHLSVA